MDVKKARGLDIEKSKPADIIQGRDLLVLGYKPGPNIGKIIQLANRLRDDADYSREAILKLIFDITDPINAIKKLESLINQTNKE